MTELSRLSRAQLRSCVPLLSSLCMLSYNVLLLLLSNVKGKYKGESHRRTVG